MNAPAAQLNPEYVGSLGLQRAPFLDQIDDRFFYADPLLVQRLDLLQHLTQFGDMLLGVSGPAGSGKSTLLQQFLLRGVATWRSCRLNGGQLPQPGDLLTQLADCFGLDRNATPERIKSDLLRTFQTLRHNTQTAVVVIDDAQLLPEPVLKTLLELGGQPRETLKLLRVILFSEPGLEQRLIQAGWHSPLQPLLHNLDLPAFDDHQTAAYLMYRLAVAGYSGESPFSLTEIRALHKTAGGLPGKLNVLAHEILMERAGRIAARKRAAPSAKTDAKPATSRKPLLIAGTAAGVLVLGAFGWYLTRPADEVPTDLQPMTESAPQHAPEAESGTESPQEPAAIASSQSEQAKQAEAAPGQDTAGTTAAGENATQAAGPADAPAQDRTPAESGPATDTPAPAGAPPADQTGPVSGAGGETASVPVAPATAVAPSTEQPPAAAAPPPAEQPPGETAAMPATPQTPAAPAAGSAPAATEEPKPETATTAAPAPEAAAKEPPSAAAPDTTGQAAPPAETSVSKPVPAAARLNLPAEVLDADWLLERPASHFTLQLLGVRSPDSLRAYLHDHALPAPVAVFRTRLKGGDWYVIVQGDYPSMSAARAAVAELPAGVRKSKPWPRSFAHVHTDIRKANP